MITNYLEKILTAPVYDVAIETPLDSMPRLSARIGHQVLCKREDLQPVFSFKCRGAYNKMYHLDEEARAKGVICSSAGNHAQGVALAAHKLQIRATIVMPKTTPNIKVDAVRRLGGEWVNIVLHGDFYDEAAAHAHELMNAYQLTYIHPFDDPYTIAGQGTIGLELLRQHPKKIDAIFVPVGGGGLLAGIALLTKSLRPDIKIIGVEPEDAASMTNAIRHGERQTLESVGIFADGVAVKQPGELTYDLIKQYADSFVTVSTDEICAAMKDLFDDTRAIAEPSGALAAAGLKKWAAQQKEKSLTLIHIVSGANVNFDRLRYIAERTEIGERREGLIAVTIPERPGAYRNFCQLIGGDNAVTEFNYRYQDENEAQIFVGLQLNNGQKQLNQFIHKLREAGYPTEDLSDNELAKEHLRYMIGGSAKVENEYLFGFGFPERPGALMHFLNTLSTDFNISLFHYRNHGSDYGRVLCGIQAKDYTSLKDHLDRIGYDYHEETDNPAYKRFLAPIKK
ncbi:threonine ammonia-lyase, biosynthetic [Suttonella ornithocola]|uniref:L-threonine dehydratase n=1 Tax=Suttonella ornithocola TaxID=279832 RepID=A0A380MY97_9GAMM|nr:threonine ammonia-lyase, biosynthetic [Suttonella ornithocola]SUO97272.1 L-threonine dehydratase biosynthetic IlvA [Suttonella ornithocola]